MLCSGPFLEFIIFEKLISLCNSQLFFCQCDLLSLKENPKEAGILYGILYVKHVFHFSTSLAISVTMGLWFMLTYKMC